MSLVSLPVVAIVGRPNVGKSTLFNALTRTRDALVADLPGVTRDRIYGFAEVDGRRVILIDTGGLEDASDELGSGRERQTRQAIEEADVLIFVTDARDGMMPADRDVGAWLRASGKALIHAINKTDGLDSDAVMGESLSLGIDPYCLISSAHRRGLERLSQLVAASLPVETAAPDAEREAGIHLALIGRPNAGKSTLLNRMLGYERALATSIPGTTRDPIRARVERDDAVFHLVDTAGIRRRRGSHEGLERFSTIKALQAMEQAEVVAVMIDAVEGITDQDARLAGHVVAAGRGLVLVLNKWDGLSEPKRRSLLKDAADKLNFALFAPVVTLSALHGSGLGELIDAVKHVHDCASADLSTPALTRALRAAVDRHSPPGGKQSTPKLRYAHGGGSFPTKIVIHGSRTQNIAEQYRRYLVNCFRREFKLTGVPVQLIFRDSDNPYAGRRNTLTPRQIQKKQRLKRFIKRRKRG
ncbi:MAG: ribosome biogenesis GTPase Der [Wenzhouxiangella sp.]